MAAPFGRPSQLCSQSPSTRPRLTQATASKDFRSMASNDHEQNHRPKSPRSPRLKSRRSPPGGLGSLQHRPDRRAFTGGPDRGHPHPHGLVLPCRRTQFSAPSTPSDFGRADHRPGARPCPAVGIAATGRHRPAQLHAHPGGGQVRCAQQHPADARWARRTAAHRAGVPTRSPPWARPRWPALTTLAVRCVVSQRSCTNLSDRAGAFALGTASRWASLGATEEMAALSADPGHGA